MLKSNAANWFRLGCDSCDAVRHQLFALVGTLCDELRGTRVSVRVRFDTLRSGAAVSGVMKSVTPSKSSEPQSKEGRASTARADEQLSTGSDALDC